MEVLVFGYFLKEDGRKRNYIYIYRKRSKDQNKREIRGLKKKEEFGFMLTPCQTYFPLGEKVGVYFFPLGRGFLVRKVFSVLVCCIDSRWLVCPVVVVLNFIFYWYLYLFSLLVCRYPFFFCFWSFRELSDFEICFASFVLILKKSSFFLFQCC